MFRFNPTNEISINKVNIFNSFFLNIKDRLINNELNLIH